MINSIGRICERELEGSGPLNRLRLIIVVCVVLLVSNSSMLLANKEQVQDVVFTIQSVQISGNECDLRLDYGEVKYYVTGWAYLCESARTGQHWTGHFEAVSVFNPQPHMIYMRSGGYDKKGNPKYGRPFTITTQSQ